MHRVYVNPLPVRIWHWTNAIGFILMILTALQIRYVGLIDVVSFRTAVLLHNYIGFVLIANFFLWLVFYLTSDKIKVYHPELDVPETLPRQLPPDASSTATASSRATQPVPRDTLQQVQSAAEHVLPVMMMIILPVRSTPASCCGTCRASRRR